MKHVLSIALLLTLVVFVTGCTEGDVWRRDCNSCGCQNGLEVCTKKLCGSMSKEQSRPVRQAQECTPGARWKEDCNNCWCANGRKACTRKLCPGARFVGK